MYVPFLKAKNKEEEIVRRGKKVRELKRKESELVRDRRRENDKTSTGDAKAISYYGTTKKIIIVYCSNSALHPSALSEP
jgi:hypothetical protein